MPASRTVNGEKPSETEILLFRLAFPPNTVDEKWHVSKDVHVAMLRLGTNKIYLYRDEHAGLRQTLYVNESENIEPDHAADASRPFSSVTIPDRMPAGSHC